jgi:hypothetical protein
VSSKCLQLYYTCSDRLFAVVIRPCSFHFSPLTVTFLKLAVNLRPLYTIALVASLFCLYVASFPLTTYTAPMNQATPQVFPMAEANPGTSIAGVPTQPGAFTPAFVPAGLFPPTVFRLTLALLWGYAFKASCV